ncbi:class I SAM-dependent methyltransferase [Poritiphilus flavus]|uniref:Methyltransferase domain-containing protein n=1 Tax=Poritiphilus flavus TaxID=2697053 RepID=A0A6L9E9U8_9FLAO|nr:class I SAM-dependent methyltransferase [Poritiphilus flavus]NAS11525.1 methyltransferase domain-containing protein [Poritiphilus flavus]
MKRISVTCYNCGESRSELYDEENGFTYVKCVGCGLVYLNPQPSQEEINSSHKMGMHRGDSTINVTGSYSPLKVKNYESVLKDFYTKESLSQDSLNWLDIGCGFGEFIESLGNYTGNKLKVIGSEPNKQKQSFCVDRNLDVTFFDIESHDVKYDFISMLNVYSHLPDPVQFVRTLKSKLKDKGELFLETGHSSHLAAEDHHKPYYAPDHISFANQSIVEDILKRNGFEIVQTKIYRHAQFPLITKNPVAVMKESAKILLNRNGSIKNLFPKSPNRDMYIRARLA